MLKTKLTCKTGLKKNIIKKEVYDREVALCRQLSKKCGWGKCKDCGVIPLLHKLYRGQLLKDIVKIKKIKNKILK